MGLVADDQIPEAVRRGQLGLNVFVAGEFVETRDDEVGLCEPIAGAGSLQLVVGENFEGQLKTPVQLILPLLCETSRAHDQAPAQIASRNQFLDEEPRHDRLAGAGVIGEQEAQWLTRQHRLIDGRDLVRQRLDLRGVDRKERIEQMRKADALCFRHEPEKLTVAVEAPRASGFGELETRLCVAEKQFIGDRAARVLVGHLDSVSAEPLDPDDRRGLVGQQTANRGFHAQFLELHARALSTPRSADRTAKSIAPSAYPVRR